MNLLYNPVFSYLYFWGWQDCVEVLLFTIVMYKTTAWLDKDRTHKLVRFFYGYCLLIILSYAIPLPFSFSLLVQASPIVAIITILMHQEILQKRFAVPTKIVPAQLSTQWIDELLQASLIAMNCNKQIVCIIEHQDALQDIITTSYPLNSPCKKTTLNMLLDSSLFEQQKFIFMSHDGVIKGINCNFLDPQDTAEKDCWDCASSLCTKIDMLAFKANAQRNTFDIVLRGNMIENLSSTHCRSVLLQFINNKTHIDTKNQGPMPTHKEKSHEKNHA